MKVVVDASTLLCAYFPDELNQNAKELMLGYVLGDVELYAPRLLNLEVTNACLVAERRGRLTRELCKTLLQELGSLSINWVGLENKIGDLYDMGSKYGISAYDAAYLLVAQLETSTLVTADKKMFNAVSASLDFVRYLDSFTLEK